MHSARKAIVLRHLSGHTVALLDECAGRLDAIVVKIPPVGTLVGYSLERTRGSMVFVDYYSLLDMPFALAREDLLFWHHVLELCFYFLPAGMQIPELFELLSFLYTVDTKRGWSGWHKKLYLFKMLIIIGFYQEMPAISALQIEYVRRLPVEALIEIQLNEEDKKRIDDWLCVCVSEHPAIKKFKTMHFLRGE